MLLRGERYELSIKSCGDNLVGRERQRAGVASEAAFRREGSKHLPLHGAGSPV